MSYDERRSAEEISFDAAMYGLCTRCGWPRTEAGRLEDLDGACPRCQLSAEAGSPRGHVTLWASPESVITLPDAVRSRVTK